MNWHLTMALPTSALPSASTAWPLTAPQQPLDNFPQISHKKSCLPHSGRKLSTSTGLQYMIGIIQPCLATYLRSYYYYLLLDLANTPHVEPVLYVPGIGGEYSLSSGAYNLRPNLAKYEILDLKIAL